MRMYEFEAFMMTMQGNGAGPAICANISSFFYKLTKNVFWAYLEAPCSNIDAHLAGFGFVVDIDHLQTGLSNDDYWNIEDTLQASVELWENAQNKWWVYGSSKELRYLRRFYLEVRQIGIHIGHGWCQLFYKRYKWKYGRTCTTRNKWGTEKCKECG